MTKKVWLTSACLMEIPTDSQSKNLMSQIFDALTYLFNVVRFNITQQDCKLRGWLKTDFHRRVRPAQTISGIGQESYLFYNAYFSQLIYNDVNGI